MSSTNMYNIIVQNNSGSRGNYVFCCAPPECNEAEVQTTAWISADVPQNGTYTVSTTDQAFAWSGTCSDLHRPDSRSDSHQDCLRQGSLVRNGCVTPVQLGNESCRGTTAHMNVERGMPMFGQSSMDARNGCFEVKCHNNIRVGDHCLIGMAKVGAHGMVAPVAVMQARPNRAISMAPRMRFYIAEQQCQTGEVIDCERMSHAVVDFCSGNGRDMTTAVICHEERGEYRVHYYNQTESRGVMQAACDGQLRSHIQRRANSHSQHRDSQNNDEHLRQLTDATLNRLISGMSLNNNNNNNNNSDAEATTMRWIGRVNWTTAIPFATASQGADMIAQHLTARGYRVDVRTLTNANNTKTAEFTVCRDRRTLMAADPEADWLAALKANAQSNDGHTNGGFNPAPAESMDRAAMRSKAQKRESLMQMNNILDQFRNGQRTEYQGNGYSNGHSDERGNGHHSRQGQSERHLNRQSNGMDVTENSTGVY